MRTILVLAAAAFALGLEARSAAAQPAPEPCPPSQTNVRDHRGQPPLGAVVRDHRRPSLADDNCSPNASNSSGGVVVSTPPPVVRDHRRSPVARDHRNPELAGVRFVVKAVSLHADDESGPDLAGSDEIVVSFRDPVVPEVRQSSVFGDFDTGETRRFGAEESCITPGPQCSAGAAAPIGFGVAVLERDDWGYWPCEYLKWRECAADALGSATISLSADMLRAVPANGAPLIQEVRLGGYTLTYSVQRVQ